MSMTLNPVNEAAFQKAVQSLETLNRAAVFHPTGTGKSCIAWKVVEAHPQTTVFSGWWPVHSVWPCGRQS